MTTVKLLVPCIFVAATLFALPARAVQVRVTIENVSPNNSVAFSPFLTAAHDGTFDAFDTGSAANAAIESIAELGDGTQLGMDIMSAQPTAVVTTIAADEGGFGPGILPPGAMGYETLSLDPSMHRYLTYGAMVVPSNDAFLGNDLPTAVEVFDAMGNFVATDFTLTGSDIWDAGTEVNQLLGAAYIVGQDAMLGTDENGVVHSSDLATEFAPYNGSMTPVGNFFSALPMDATPIASFSFQVVPEPNALMLTVLGVVSLIAVRHRRVPR